jgi:peptide/nickel transport system permease protein
MKLINYIRRSSPILFWSLIGILLVGLLANFIANDRPLFASKKGEFVMPFLGEHNPMLIQESYDWKIMALVPYSPQSLDYNNVKSASPFKSQQVASLRYRHWLGTDELGRDILSGIIHGTRLALFIGIGSMLIASIIGLFWGAIAGFFGDNTLKVSWLNVFLLPIFIFIGYFYGFHQSIFSADSTTFSLIQITVINLAFIALSIVTCIYISQYLHQILKLKRLITIPIDLIISRIIEIVKSVPVLFLVISLAALVQPSAWNIIGIIGLLAWTNIARYSRAEVLKVKNKPFVESAKALGYSNARILFKHVLPLSIQSASVFIVFGIAGAILMESTLSFIGIGIAADHVSWGSILSEARKSPSSWWLAVFPGLAIFMTLYLFNRLATVFEDRNRN